MSASAAVDLGRVPRLAGYGVLVLSATLALVEVGRFAVVGTGRDVVVAAVATGAYLPAHLWHLRYGVIGARPPRSGVTLVWVGVVQVAALVLLGPTWSYSLAATGTSGLVVLAPRWSGPVLAACVAAPGLGYLLRPDLAGAFGSPLLYLMLSVGFRALVLFTLVRLVAAAYELAASRAALAGQAARRERDRVEAAVRGSVEVGLSELFHRARRVVEVLDGGQPAAASARLQRVLDLSRSTLAELREVVAVQRSAAVSTPDDGLTVRRVRGPVLQGLTRGSPWRGFVLVHAVVLGYLLLNDLGLFTDRPGRVWLAVATWPFLAAAQVWAAVAVARGRPVRFGTALWMITVVLVVGLRPWLGDLAQPTVWLAGSVGLLAFRGGAARVLALTAAGVAAGMGAWYMATYLPDASSGDLLWIAAYTLAIDGLAVAGLYGSGRLVRLVHELAEARDALAAEAADTERLRVSRDVHDLIGQALSAISLKGDLARRLLDKGDVPAARRHVAELVALAADQPARLAQATSGELDTDLKRELATATALLQQAGIDVDVQIGLGPLDPATSRLLGKVVREGTTNVLRHARPRRCQIRGERRDGQLLLELVNDGVSGAAPGVGSGLAGLAESAEAMSSRVEGTASGDGRFTLSVSIPEGVPA